MRERTALQHCEGRSEPVILRMDELGEDKKRETRSGFVLGSFGLLVHCSAMLPYAFDR